jgi:hypothetical protein
LLCFSDFFGADPILKFSWEITINIIRFFSILRGISGKNPPLFMEN